MRLVTVTKEEAIEHIRRHRLRDDKLIKYVEQSPIKTEELKKLIKQVKAMKKVDMRKPESNEYGIPLTLKISKGGKQKQ